MYTVMSSQLEEQHDHANNKLIQLGDPESALDTTNQRNLDASQEQRDILK
jgi:hypothetical protein